MQRAHHIEMLVLQSTAFCNLDCAYCYLPSRDAKGEMSEATLRRACERVFGSGFLGDELTILWHAGEPLVPGIAYYERAFEIVEELRPRGLKIIHNVQTNATLLTPRWIDLFRTHDVRVGVSLDGSRHLHDAQRKTRRGGGSFDQTMRGVGVLRDAGYPFHVITVLTRNSLAAPRALYDFYAEHGVSQVAFNFDETEGGHTRSSMADAPEREMRAFYEAFLDIGETHPHKIQVREFLAAYAAIANAQSTHYGNPLAEPMRMLSIAVDGGISSFSPELLGYASARHGAFVFGNVHECDLAAVLADARFAAVSDEIARGQALCRANCEYFEMCQGGSPANKHFENGAFDTTETLFCRLSKKAVIDVVLERIERELALVA